MTDLGNGGATEVFMRLHTNQSAKSASLDGTKPAVVFAPKLMQRMDCYCYASDQYGSKVPGTFNQRISPAQLVKQLAGAYNSGHEVMMHDAVSLSEAEYIVYNYPDQVIQRLKAAGIKSIGGKPLEKAVITPEQFKKVTL